MKTRHSAEQIVSALRRAVIALGKGLKGPVAPPHPTTIPRGVPIPIHAISFAAAALGGGMVAQRHEDVLESRPGFVRASFPDGHTN